MEKYITLESTSSVDMLRFRIRYRGKPEDAHEWYKLLIADMKTKYYKPDPNEPHKAMMVIYPLTLRMGTYRDMAKMPVNDTSIEIAMGRNGKGGKDELREGYIEFNPAKTYPSPQLEFIYRRIAATPEIVLELVRWDFATDYKADRARFALMRDSRKYGCQISQGFTEYLGTRHKNGFVKLYDKQKELQHQGKEQKEPLTRLEITIEEKPGKTIWYDGEGKATPAKEWPQVVAVPEEVPETASGQTALVVLAWTAGKPLEECLQYVPARSRTRIRNYVKETCGKLIPPTDYDFCRNDALAWQSRYGGLAGKTA